MILLKDGERKARKTHTCDLCGEKIEKGEIYKFAVYNSSGELLEFKNHKKCDYVFGELTLMFSDPEDVSTSVFLEACDDFTEMFIGGETDINAIYEHLQYFRLAKNEKMPWKLYCVKR